MSLSTENRTGTLRWSKGAARLSYDSPKAPSRRPQGTLKDPWRYVEHRAAAVRAPCVSLAMLNHLTATANTIPLDINTGTAGADSGFVNGGGGGPRFLPSVDQSL